MQLTAILIFAQHTHTYIYRESFRTKKVDGSTSKNTITTQYGKLIQTLLYFINKLSTILSNFDDIILHYLPFYLSKMTVICSKLTSTILSGFIWFYDPYSWVIFNQNRLDFDSDSESHFDKLVSDKFDSKSDYV